MEEVQGTAVEDKVLSNSLSNENNGGLGDSGQIDKEEPKDDLKSNSDEDEKDDGWLDVLGSGQLLKKIIKKGIEDTRPQRLDICSVKYEGKYNDVVVDEGNVNINVGDAELVQGLDFVLPLMDLEEEAEVIIGPRFAFGAEGRKPDIPPDATLHYTVTLLSAEPEPPLETLSYELRRSVGNRKKERGNHWYARKEHTLAIQCYRRALEYLDDIGLSTTEEGSSKQNKASEEEVHSMLEERMKVYNNLAAAQMKIKAFEPALQSVDNVLRCQPDNVKALFRKGKILAEKGETEEAISLLKKMLRLDPDNVPAKNELNLLYVKQKRDIAQQKKLYQKMLGGNNKAAEKTPTSPTKEIKKWGMLAACVGGAFSAFLAYKYYKPI